MATSEFLSYKSLLEALCKFNEYDYVWISAEDKYGIKSVSYDKDAAAVIIQASNDGSTLRVRDIIKALEAMEDKHAAAYISTKEWAFIKDVKQDYDGQVVITSHC
jgi:hypothetical protein